MKTLLLQQGEQEWLDARADHFTASEAPAMMGASKYTTRTELLRQKTTGIASDVDSHKQRLFDSGHAAESAACPIVEAIIGGSLYPVTGSLEVDGLPLLASFDGLDMSGDIVWETKLWNAALADQVRAGQLEPHYYWQLEQQLLVSGAVRAYFTTSDGTPENTLGMWYQSQPERRAKLIAGWKQFQADLAEYQHVEATVAPVAAPIEALPAISVQLSGAISVIHNLDEFKAAALARIADVNSRFISKLDTDQDEVDAREIVNNFSTAEGKIEMVKAQMRSAANIEDAIATLDFIKDALAKTRIALDKEVKSFKGTKKSAIVASAHKTLNEHIEKLEERIGGRWMSHPDATIFTNAIAGLKSLDSMRDKVSAALANAKIEANEIADLISANRLELVGELDWSFLVPDFATVCTKARDDFDSLLMARIAKHNEAQAAKDKAAKDAEDARVAAAVEAERRAGEARAAAAIEAERMAEAKRAAEAEQQVQRGKADAGVGLSHDDRAQPEAAITPPSRNATVTAPITVEGYYDEARAMTIIDDYLRLLAISPAEKKARREFLVPFVRYQAAREAMAIA